MKNVKMKKNNFPNYKIITKLLRKKLEDDMRKELELSSDVKRQMMLKKLDEIEEKQKNKSEQNEIVTENVEKNIEDNQQSVLSSTKDDAIPLPNESVIDSEQIKPIEPIEEDVKDDTKPIISDSIEGVDLTNDDEKIINPFAKPADEIPNDNAVSQQLNVPADKIDSVETPQLYNEENISPKNEVQTDKLADVNLSAKREQTVETPQLYNEDAVNATPVEKEKDTRLEKFARPLAAGTIGAAVGAAATKSGGFIKEKVQAIKEVFTGKNEKTLLGSIADNLINVNKSIENILRFKKDESKTPNLPKIFEYDRQVVEPDGKSTGKKDEGSIFSTVLKTLGIGLFLIAPALIKFIKEKVDSIRKFFEPAFNFFSEAFEFILNDIPEFFVEDIPNFFLDKFKKLQEKADYFINSARIMISEIKKKAGEIIVALGQKIKDLPFDAAKEIGQSIVDFGQELVDDANATIDSATIENDEIEKTSELQKVAENYVKELKTNDKTIEDATVIIDREKGVFNIELNYGHGEKVVQNFDFFESMRRGKVVPLGGEEEPISDINELLGIGSSAYAARAASGSPKTAGTEPSVGKDAAKVPASLSGMNASINLPGNEYQTIAGQKVEAGKPLTEEQTAAVQIRNEMRGGGASSPPPAAVPVSSTEQQSTAPSISAGQTISDESLKATDPSLDPATKQNMIMPRPSSATMPSSKPGISRNWSIDVVPDPSIAFGSLAEDLFYIKA